MKVKKYLSVLLIVVLILFQNSSVFAFEVPGAPTPPTAPEITTEAPPPPEAPEAPTTPEAPTAPTLEEALADPEPTPTTVVEGESDSPQETSAESQPQESNYQNGSGGNVGDTSIETGDATSQGIISSLGNTNASNQAAGGGGSVSVINDGNGSDSTNDGSVNLINNNNTFQDNSSVVANGLTGGATSGDNTSDGNVGNTIINTGDATATGTVITGVNTNVAGVLVSEFNILDDQVGDVVLDFGAGCISGCSSSSSILAKNSGNGTDSQNDASVTDVTNNNTFQTNDATVLSELTLDANSGDNSSSENTNGDSAIETGDANVAANVLAFVNNNLAGSVVFGVVNIIGDLVGDIILPESEVAICSNCGGDVTAQNSGNGSDSDNNATANQTINNNSFQYNDATIENALILAATTGSNETSGNTGGDSSITTGDSSVYAQVLNVANSNIDGGAWWLVIVNEAGQWIGKILGSPDGSNFAGSEGTDFVINESGEITAINSGNGSGSNNNSSVSQTTNNTTVQTNEAHLVNNLNLSANTGGNDANNNTGGNNTIKTGDAQIIVNLVNFANNNIKTGGKLIVTVVNVFGSWIGDFVAPGYQKNNKDNQEENNSSLASSTPNIGGPSSSGSNNNSGLGFSSSSQPSNSNNNNNSSSSNANTQAASSESNANNSTLLTSSNPIFPQQVKVSGISSGSTFDIINENSEDKDSKTKAININLAWLLILIPAGLAYMVIKRKLNPLNFLSRKSV